MIEIADMTLFVVLGIAIAFFAIVGMLLVFCVDTDLSMFLGAVCMITAGVILACMLVLIPVVNIGINEDAYALAETTPIYAVKDGTYVKGDLIVGIGGIKSEQVYICYKPCGNSTYKQFSIPAEATLLCINNTEIPRVETYTHMRYADVGAFRFIHACPDMFKLYVPENGVSCVFHNR